MKEDLGLYITGLKAELAEKASAKETLVKQLALINAQEILINDTILDLEAIALKVKEI